MNEAEYLIKNYGDRGECYRPRRITSSEISIILYMIRKPNSITVLLFIQNNSWFKTDKAKTCLASSMLSSPSIVHVLANILQIADVALRVVFFVIISPSSYSRNEWNVRHFLFSQRKQLNLVPRSSRVTVH